MAKYISRRFYLKHSLMQDVEQEICLKLLITIRNAEEKNRGLDDDNKRLLYFLLRKLNSEERKILIYRYGLGGSPKFILRELADKYNCNISYIYKIQKRGEKKIRIFYKNYNEKLE